jgi:hypothetical protein
MMLDRAYAAGDVSKALCIETLQYVSHQRLCFKWASAGLLVVAQKMQLTILAAVFFFGSEQIDPRSLHVVAEVPAFDHCQFDALPSMSKDRRQVFSSALFAMDFGDAADRPVMQAEGITRRYFRSPSDSNLQNTVCLLPVDVIKALTVSIMRQVGTSTRRRV